MIEHPCIQNKTCYLCGQSLVKLYTLNVHDYHHYICPQNIDNNNEHFTIMFGVEEELVFVRIKYDNNIIIKHWTYDNYIMIYTNNSLGSSIPYFDFLSYRFVARKPRPSGRG